MPFMPLPNALLQPENSLERSNCPHIWHLKRSKLFLHKHTDTHTHGNLIKLEINWWIKKKKLLKTCVTLVYLKWITSKDLLYSTLNSSKCYVAAWMGEEFVGEWMSPCLFNLYADYIMRNTGLKEAQAGIKMLGEISVTSYMQMTPPLWQKVKKN